MLLQYFILCLLWLSLVEGQVGIPIFQSNNVVECGLIIISCQAQCKSDPDIFGGSFVRWMVAITNSNLSCTRYNNTDTPEEVPPGDLISTFDVFCCDERSSIDPLIIKTPRTTTLPPTQPPQSSKIECVDQKKLDTLFILGVATLASILLMCAFVMMGLILYKRRTRYYKYSPPLHSEESRSLVKETEKVTNTMETASDLDRDKSACSSPGNCVHKATPPPHYYDAKTKSSTSSRSSKHETENKYVNGDVVSANPPTLMNDYFNRGEGKKVPDEENDKTYESIASKRLSSRMEVAGDYEIRGGFIRPINKSVEPKSMKLLRSDEPKGETASFPVNHTETTFQSPPIKSKSSDVVEDPYVQAPPLKSLRSQTKLDQPDAYQKLIPSNASQKHDTSDYNMLLHNGDASNASDAKQFLILNNNPKPSTCNSTAKCEVILKSTPSSPTVEVQVTS